MSIAATEATNLLIESLKRSLQTEQQKTLDLERKIEMSKQDAKANMEDQDAKEFRNYMRAERAEARCKVLEEELINSAKSFGKQIAKLKEKIMTLEQAETNSSNNGARSSVSSINQSKALPQIEKRTSF